MQASLDKYGIVNDRAWLLVTHSGLAMTQREFPAMALIVPKVDEAGALSLTAPGIVPIMLPRTINGASIKVRVWSDECVAVDQGEDAAQWLSRAIGKDCRLVVMDENFDRPVDPEYATNAQQVGFADGFPFLLISEGSLADLNTKLEFPLPMNRFRPNIVVSGAEAFAEDEWRSIRIGSVLFDVVKPCSRCVMTSIDQEDGVLGREPLRTLAAYRKFGNKLLFGQNLVHNNTGSISVGDTVEIIA